YLLSKFGAHIRLVGPPTLIPDMAGYGVEVFYNMEDGLKDVDVIMMLRIQTERQGKGLFPSTLEYFKNWGLDTQRLELADKDAVVMHPGPMNRGIEISSDVADSAQSIILDQVTNGIAVRMAVMYLLGGAKENA
ncbi:MAG TPA: aspartate carbamoyltransferase, partial [Nitrospiraceae bacterium]|nr:aspartate carbamoyltransferase [Nitrospiraceae bacterium]